MLFVSCAFMLCSRLSFLPVAASGPSQRCSLCRGSDPGEIHGLLFHQPTPLHPAPSPRGLPASTPSPSWFVSLVICQFKRSIYHLCLDLVTCAFSAPSVGRLVPLCQEEVSRAVRQQQLSEVWTVDYAQDLLLLGGLLPETVWLAYHLGDWKTAVSLSLAYTNYCTDHFDFTRLRRRELHLPTDLEPESIFQVELQCLLGNTSDSQECREKDGDMSFTGW